MRFSKLALERYGHFDGCELSFPTGSTDLHVIYGPNEAGKSTSLAAVSDLLFGFPTRSPYNFRFDYSLLRVGAVLEDDGSLLACRRRKSGTTLIDGADKAIDEGVLLAMLRGQTRDTFRLSFSLDQDALRRGGRAMVDAKNDVGQALFAAGSGLTGVAEELRRIEEEADSIWGKRTKATRSFTLAERELESSLRAIRDDSLKPKEWSNARKILDLAMEKLAGLEAARDALLLESRKADRVRRIAGNVRLRADLLARLTADNAPIALTAHVEALAVTAITEAEAATRQLAVADRLLQELDDRAKQLVADPAVLQHAEAIEALVKQSGAVAKAARDLGNLSSEHRTAETNLTHLHNVAGTAAGTSLSSSTSATLRDLARQYAADAATLAQIDEFRIGLENRRAALAARLEPEVADQSLMNLVDAVDAARRLGGDADSRCMKARKAADGAARDVTAALARLSPWTGTIATLRALPPVGTAEIAEARTAWAQCAKSSTDEESEARRCDEELAKIALRIAALPSGSVVSDLGLAQGRAARSAKWAPIKAHILDAAPLSDAISATHELESAMVGADDLADRRFALADASARLAAFETARAALQLEASQARQRAAHLHDTMLALRRQWDTRLQSLQLPGLEPIQLENWFEGRTIALQLEDERARRSDEADEFENSRAMVIARLREQLGEGEKAAAPDLADILARAERTRRLRESRLEAARSDRQKLIDLDADLMEQERKRGVVAARNAVRLQPWAKALVGTGIALDINDADGRLTAMDNVRQSIEAIDRLKRRIDDIGREAAEYNDDLTALASRLGQPTSDDPEDVLQTLRSRSQQGQTAKQLLNEIASLQSTRMTERDGAVAALDAAIAVLKPIYLETSTTDPASLSEVIERSRSMRSDRATLAGLEAQIIRDGDGLALRELVASVEESNLDQLLARTETLARELSTLNAAISEAATNHGDAGRAFDDLEGAPRTAADAASDAEQARAEMAVQAEAYILKRAQAFTLKWAIEEYRLRHQDPMLVRASELFATLTVNRYSALRIELDGPVPRLLGITDDGRTAVDVTGMSEGTTDQLFLSLRLAAVEQSVAAGIRLPFLADDLFVNFDDERSEAGFRVLAQLAQKTQVLFFTHHAHLAKIARKVVGETAYSECALA